MWLDRDREKEWGKTREQGKDSGREIRRPRGAKPGSRWSRQMEQQRQRTELQSGHAARPGSQALWISVGSRCLDGSSS